MEISTPGKTGRLDADPFCRAHVASIFSIFHARIRHARPLAILPSVLAPLDAEGTGRVERGDAGRSRLWLSFETRATERAPQDEVDC
jgi:hypothetical protein